MKRAANVSIDAELLSQAKALDINLSRTLEQSLRSAVAEAKAERWQADNAEAIAAYNRWVAQHGLPLARYRQF